MLCGLKWTRSTGRQFMFAGIGRVRVWAELDFSNYDIDIRQGAEHIVFGENYWQHLDPIAAQAILYHALEVTNYEQDSARKDGTQPLNHELAQ
jgi:hypothetical protein